MRTLIRSPLAGYIVVAVTVAAVPWIQYGFDPRVYFLDDFQAQYLPAFREIGRLLSAGEAPWLTLRAWIGGAFLGEYQFGVFNPVNLLMSFLVHRYLSDLNLAAAGIVISHLAIFGLGVYAVCRRLACGFEESLFAAVIAATSGWLTFWYATTWVPGLISLAWLAWAVAGFLGSRVSLGWTVAGSLFVYMTLVSGWPHNDLALAIFIACYGVLAWREEGAAGAARVLAMTAIGGLLAAPALLPLLAYHETALRPPGFPNPFAWSTPLHAFVGIGFPTFGTLWPDWAQKYRFIVAPWSYLTWAAPAMLWATWRQAPGSWRRDEVKLLSYLVFIFAVLALMPALGTLRYPFRFIALVHMWLAVLLAVLVSRRRAAGDHAAGWTRRTVTLTATVPCFFAMLGADWVQLVTLAALIAAGYAIIALDGRGFRRWLLVVLAVHLAFYTAVGASSRFKTMVADWGTPNNVAELAHRELGEGNILFVYARPHSHKSLQWLQIGMLPLLNGHSTLNGYSPMLQMSWSTPFCFRYLGHSCPEFADKLFAVEPTTGRAFAELAKIATFVVEKDSRWDGFRARLASGWRIVHDDADATVFARPPERSSLDYPGTISYLPRGLTVTLRTYKDSREVYDVVAGPDYGGGPVVFARPWYPGYAVTLDGRPQDYRRLGELLPAVTLPPGFKGRLAIEYVPAGLERGVALALVGLASLIVLVVVTWRRRRRSPATA